MRALAGGVVYPDMNLSDTQVGVGCLVLGAVTMVNWWFAMFSDHWYGDLGRSFGEGEFNVGRNTIALTLPSVGLIFLCGGVGVLFEHGARDGDVVVSFFYVAAITFLVITVLSLIPFPLPAPMYPEWQMEKRRARAEAAARDAGLDDEPVRSTGRHAAEPRKPRPRGPGRHAK